MAGIGPLRLSTDVRCQIATDFILTLAFWRPAAFATLVLPGGVASIASDWTDWCLSLGASSESVPKTDNPPRPAARSPSLRTTKQLSLIPVLSSLGFRIVLLKCLSPCSESRFDGAAGGD